MQENSGYKMLDKFSVFLHWETCNAAFSSRSWGTFQLLFLKGQLPCQDQLSAKPTRSVVKFHT